MFNYIKLLLKKNKNIMLLLSIFNVNNNSNNNNINKKNEFLDKNKLIVDIINKNYNCKNNRIKLLLIKKYLKEKNENNIIKKKNILNNIKKESIIEENNFKFSNFLYNKINYPNSILSNYKKNELKNLKSFFNFIIKQDKFLKKRYCKSKHFKKLAPKKLYYLQSKFAKKTAYHDRIFNMFFNHVNAIPKKRRMRRKHFIAKWVHKLNERSKILFFQGRPKKMRQFKKLRKIFKKRIIVELKKDFKVNFKKYSYEKKIYKKNIILNTWKKIIYNINNYKIRTKYNLALKNNINSTKKIYKKLNFKFFKIVKKKYLPLFKIRKEKFKFSPNFTFRKRRRLRYSNYRLIYTRGVFRRTYFNYSKFHYRRFWVKGSKNKLILEKEKLIDSEYYYMDMDPVLCLLKSKNISLTSEYFDYLSLIISDKSISLLFYVFLYIPLILFIHLIRKEYYKRKKNINATK